jgi:hypothetical protein
MTYYLLRLPINQVIANPAAGRKVSRKFRDLFSGLRGKLVYRYGAKQEVCLILFSGTGD